jgi:hypothetical protein
MPLTDITSIAKTTMGSRNKEHCSSKTTASMAEAWADVANKMMSPTKEVKANKESITYLEGPPLSETVSDWYQCILESPQGIFIDLHYLKTLKPTESAPIAWCWDTQDINKVENYVLANLCRSNKHLWEVTDMEHYVLTDLEWKGNK